MRLIAIMQRNFILPLAIFLFLSIIITLLINLFYTKKFKEKTFQDKIKKNKVQSSSLVLSFTQELLYERFQLVFDYLITASEVLDKYHSSLDEDVPCEKSLNGLINLFRNEYEDENKIDENKMCWFIKT